MKQGCRNFFYLAPPFDSFSGHYYNYAHGLFHACQKLGISFLALGAAKARLGMQFPGNLPFRPLFHEPGPFRIGKVRVRSLGRPRNFLLSYKTLRTVQKLPGFEQDAFCLIEEPRLFDTTTLQFWLQGLKHSNCPTLSFLFRYGLRSADGARWLPMRDSHHAILKVLDIASKTLPVRILSDSHLVAEHLRELTAMPVEVIPTHFYLPGEMPSASVPTNPDIIQFYIPGSAAVTKGTPLLVRALEILKNDPAFKSMHFTIPFYTGPFTIPEVDESLKLLQSLALSNVTILHDGLGQDEYYQRLYRSDLILTPYDPERYQATSGPFAEAMALGKPVITSGRTWMSAMLEKGHGAGLVFSFADARALASVLKEAVSRFDELSRLAGSRKTKWIQSNGPDAILRILIK